MSRDHHSSGNDDTILLWQFGLRSRSEDHRRGHWSSSSVSHQLTQGLQTRHHLASIVLQILSLCLLVLTTFWLYPRVCQQQVSCPLKSESRELGFAGALPGDSLTASPAQRWLQFPLICPQATLWCSEVTTSLSQGFLQVPGTTTASSRATSSQVWATLANRRQRPGVPCWAPSVADMEPFPDVAEEESAVLPLTSDFGPAGFQPYALDLVGLGLASDESPLVLAYVVMTRRDGFLLCLPELALPLEVLQGGNEAAPQDLVGPSLKVEVQCAVLDEDAILQMPSPLEGKTNVSAFGGFCKCGPGLFAGCQRQAEVGRAGCLRRARHITVVPDPDDVVTRANAWAQGLGGDQLERIQYYSADEVPEAPLALKQREPQDARSRSWYWWRHRHKTAYSCESCGVDRGADTNFAGDFREASGTHAHTRGDGGGSSTPPRTCISLAKAIGFLSYDWIAWSLNGPCGTSETDATTEKYYFPGEDTQGLFLQSGSSRDCLGG